MIVGVVLTGCATLFEEARKRLLRRSSSSMRSIPSAGNAASAVAVGGHDEREPTLPDPHRNGGFSG